MSQLRAVIYARYSSDLQREASIEDQNEVCRRYIRSMGWTLVKNYSDAALSGASQHRPAYQSLIADAKQHKFDIVVSEAVDRLGRRLADTADLLDKLSFLGIRLFTPSLGEITTMHVGIMGMMAQLALKDLAAKTKRGQLGRVRQGKVAGGLSYGYRVIDCGGSEGGHRAIDPLEAQVVRRIFDEYIAGKTPENIAKDLNADGIAGPYGRLWSNTTIRGQARRGNGILNNQAYAGILNWNRCSYVKDPSTGKRVARPNPVDQWESVAVPELRIIEDGVWQDVKRRQDGIRQSLRGQSGLRAGLISRDLNATHRPRYLLSGLLKCAECGGNFIVTGKDRFSCSTRRRKGTCSCKLSISHRSIDDRVLAGLKERLVTPQLIATFVKEFQSECKRRQIELRANRERVEKRIAEIDRKTKAIIAAIEDGFYQAEMKSRMSELTSEKLRLVELSADTAQIDQVVIHPRLHELYARKVEELEKMLSGDNATAARELIRSLIRKVTITQKDGPDGYGAVLPGELAAILAASAEPQGTNSSKKQLPGNCLPGSQLSVVAGRRIGQYQQSKFRSRCDGSGGPLPSFPRPDEPLFSLALTV